MRQLKIKDILILGGIGLFSILPTILIYLRIIPHYTIENEQVHSNIEAIGGILSLLIVFFFYKRFHNDKEELDLSYVAMAFLGMGIFDLYHAFTDVGNNFVFSHVIAVFNGGFWFAILGLSRNIRSKLRTPFWFRLTIITWIVLLFFLIFSGELLPRMFTTQGEFSLTTDLINAFAGLGFLIGTFRLLQRYARSNEKEIFLIAIIGILQGLSRLTFHWSELWDIDWWIWHGLRLVSSIIVLFVIFRLYDLLIDQLKIENNTKRQILNAMPFGLMIVNQNKQITQINHAITEMTGFLEKELIDHFCYDTLCTASCDQCPILDRNETIDKEKRYLTTKDGKQIPVLKTAIPISLEGENLILEGLIDISAQEKATADLEANEKKFRDIFDNVTNSIIIIDLKGRIKEVNQTATIQYGYSKEEFAQLNPITLIHPDYHTEYSRFKQELMEKGSFAGETVDIKKDGTTFNTDVSGTIVMIENEPHMLAAIRDISEIKRTENALNITLRDLQQTNLELEQFAFVSSHDLQEPLRKIKNFSDIIIRKYDKQLDDKGLHYLEIISGAVLRMQLLIDNLLTLSNISKNSDRQTTDIPAIIKKVKTELSEEIASSNTAIEAKNLPSISANKSQIRLLFYHLLSNSIKFRSARKPQIHIQATEKNDHWQFSVKDNGIGFSEEYAVRIFDVFQRLHSKQDYQGTGIGLAICKKIVAGHAGEIWAESEPGLGTTIHFTINKNR